MPNMALDGRQEPLQAVLGLGGYGRCGVGTTAAYGPPGGRYGGGMFIPSLVTLDARGGWRENDRKFG